MLGYSPRRLKSYPGEDALAFPPLQLGPEDREELRLREAHEADPGGALDHLYGVVLPEAHADLAVHGDHDVLVRHQRDLDPVHAREDEDRKSTRLNSSHMSISYAVFCLKKKKKTYKNFFFKKKKKKKKR